MRPARLLVHAALILVVAGFVLFVAGVWLFGPFSWPVQASSFLLVASPALAALALAEPVREARLHAPWLVLVGLAALNVGGFAYALVGRPSTTFLQVCGLAGTVALALAAWRAAYLWPSGPSGLASGLAAACVAFSAVLGFSPLRPPPFGSPAETVLLLARLLLAPALLLALFVALGWRRSGTRRWATRGAAVAAAGAVLVAASLAVFAALSAGASSWMLALPAGIASLAGNLLLEVGVLVAAGSLVLEPAPPRRGDAG